MFDTAIVDVQTARRHRIESDLVGKRWYGCWLSRAYPTYAFHLGNAPACWIESQAPGRSACNLNVTPARHTLNTDNIRCILPATLLHRSAHSAFQSTFLRAKDKGATTASEGNSRLQRPLERAIGQILRECSRLGKSRAVNDDSR